MLIENVYINYKSRGNICRHFYLTCVEIRFCCKLQQFCCSCNSTFRVRFKIFTSARVCRFFCVLTTLKNSRHLENDSVIEIFHCLFIVLKIPLFPCHSVIRISTQPFCLSTPRPMLNTEIQVFYYV